MPTNIELKAKLRDMERAIKIAKSLASQDPTGTRLVQEDTFFNASQCRMKLRIQNGQGSLISYDRMDKEGAKRSDFEVYRFSDNPESLRIVLEKGLGILGVVKKVRELYIVECQGLSTRVHIDRVEDLGDYIEFEVIIPEEDQVQNGNEVIAILKEKFHIKDDDLISGAYMDKIIENNQNKF